MTDSEVQDLLDHYVDFDENGEINYKEFVKQTFDFFK
jgi:Ca2+-binding EF-hand superfamily protein